MSSSESEQDRLDETPEPQSNDTVGKKRRLWSKHEDERLRLLVSYWGDQGGRRSNWDKIAANFENRSAKSCRKRWFHSLDPKLRRGRWNSTEDKILKESYDRLGPAWQRIAQLIPGRTDDQCAKRYNDVVCPDVQDRLRPWEREEDEKLLSLYAKHGSKWQTIALEMPRRTGLTCRNRWRKLTRPLKNNASKSENGEGNAVSGDRAGSDGSGNSRSKTVEGGGAESNDPLLPFDVPGSNQIAGFPAGADANWLLATGSGMYSQGLLPQLNGPAPGTQRHLTITIDDPNNPPQTLLQQTHHAITDLHLDRILDHAAKNGQHIVIHQHIYQMPNQDAQASSATAASHHHETHTHTHSHPPPQHAPLQTPHPHSHAQLSQQQQPQQQPPPPQPHTPSQSAQGLHRLSHLSQHDASTLPSAASRVYALRPMSDEPPSAMMRSVHPPVQPPERSHSRPNMIDSQSFARQSASSQQHSHEQAMPTSAAPQPYEFMSRPLLFEEPAENPMMNIDSEEVDFLAFNPS